MSDSAVPVQDRDRLFSLDVIRGVSVLGILILNMIGFALPIATYGNPLVWGGDTPADINTYIWVKTLFDGCWRAIFSALFGAGMILFMKRLSNRLPGNQAADIYMRRNVLLIIFGVIHSYLLLWFGDILFVFGLGALLLYPLRNSKISILFIVMLMMMAFQASKPLVELSTMPADFPSAEEISATLNSAKESANVEVSNRHQGWWHNVTSFASRSQFMHGAMTYIFSIWDSMVGMLGGMILFRLGVFTLDVPRKYYVAMLVVGFGIGGPTRYILTQNIVDAEYVGVAVNHFEIFFDTGRFLMASAYIALILLMIQSGILKWLQNAFAAIGKTALTNYIMHTVIAIFLFTGVGFSQFGEFSRFELNYIIATIFIAQLIISPIWLRYFQYGPLEWVWRSLTYGKKQSFKKVSL